MLAITRICMQMRLSAGDIRKKSGLLCGSGLVYR